MKVNDMKRNDLWSIVIGWLLAGVAGVIWAKAESHFEPAGPTPVVIALRRLQGLYEAGSFKAAADESDRFVRIPGHISYEPEAWYVRILSLEQLGQISESQKLEHEFLTKYPSHYLAADLHFRRAMGLLASHKFQEGASLLGYITDHFPGTRAAFKAQSLQNQLKYPAKTG